MDSICIICFEKIAIDADFCKTKCKHLFHTSCLLSRNKHDCPVCNKNIINIKPIDIESDINNSLHELREISYDGWCSPIQMRKKRITNPSSETKSQIKNILQKLKIPYIEDLSALSFSNDFYKLLKYLIDNNINYDSWTFSEPQFIILDEEKEYSILMKTRENKDTLVHSSERKIISMKDVLMLQNSF